MKKSKGAVGLWLAARSDLRSLRRDNKGRARIMKSIEATKEYPSREAMR